MLTPEDLATIQADLVSLAADAEQTITYKRYTGTTGGDPALGIAPTDSYTDEVTTARVREIDLEEAEKSGGKLVLGDVEFVVRRTSASYRDRLVWNGYTYQPKQIAQIWLGGLLGYVIKAGKM